MEKMTVGKIEFRNESLFPAMVGQKLIANNWEEEFKDNLDESWFSDILIRQLFRKYNLLNSKVKLKCRDGAILIEKV